MTVILKNTTTSGIRIEDLYGIGIDAGNQRDVTNKFSVWQLSNSTNLISYINDGTIVLNDGTKDLTVSESLDFITPVNAYTTINDEDAIAYSIVLGG